MISDCLTKLAFIVSLKINKLALIAKRPLGSSKTQKTTLEQTGILSPAAGIHFRAPLIINSNFTLKSVYLKASTFENYF